MKWFIVLLFAMVLAGCGEGYRAEGLANYDKEGIVSKYHSDLDSCLAVFPDLPDEADGVLYHASLDTGLFDTDGEIILSCTYDKEKFSGEIQRLKDISMVIHDGDETFENKILYDETSYLYPAFIANDGFGNTYEYALANAQDNTVVYLYLAYPSRQQIEKYAEWMKNDRESYEQDGMHAYSIYCHSFDGGRTWVEFDD